MFGKKTSSSQESASETIEPVAVVEETRAHNPQAKKGVPTPRRKDREAARKRPLVSNDPAEARRRRREERIQNNERVRHAFETGEEKYLPFKHKGANRKLVRAVVDAHFRFSEILIFVVLPMLFISIAFASNLQLQTIVSNTFMAYLALVILENIVVVRLVRRKQKQEGIDRQSGDVFYVVERMWMFRKLRTPKPGV